MKPQHSPPGKMKDQQETLVQQLLNAKAQSGKKYSQIAAETGLTNLHVAGLLKCQSLLANPMISDTTIHNKLVQSLPGLYDDGLIEEMWKANRARTTPFNPDLLQEPIIYRLHEAIMHFGESIKDTIYDELYDGYLSALDSCCSVDRVQGVDGKDRVVLTLDGRFRPYTENVEFSLLNYPRQPKRYSRMEENTRTIVNQLLYQRKQSGKTINEIAQWTGLTNVYVAQLFRRQAQLKVETANKLRTVVSLSDELIEEMMKLPMRFYDPNLYVEPLVYELYNSVMGMGENIKEIINEEFGDGIMSTVDFYCSVQMGKGEKGLHIVKIIFDGKFLPYTEQKIEHMVSRFW